MKKQEKLIAYLILAHHQPEHFYDLVTQLNHQEVYFFVHVDKKTDQNLFSVKVEKLQNISFIKERKNIIWGGFAMCEATLRLIKSALHSKYQFKYYVLLSGSCYPIQPTKKIMSFFQDNNKNYIALWQENIEYKKWKFIIGGLFYKEEYFYHNKQYFFFLLCKIILIFFKKHKKHKKDYCQYYKKSARSFSYNLTSYYPFAYKISRWIQPIEFFLNIILPKKKILKKNFKLYAGTQWWYLNQDAIQFLLDVLQDKKNQYILNDYKFSLCSDERMFHLILGNHSLFSKHLKKKLLFSNESQYLRHFGPVEKTWPPILDDKNFLNIKNSPALFARKFCNIKSKKLKQKIQKFIS